MMTSNYDRLSQHELDWFGIFRVVSFPTCFKHEDHVHFKILNCHRSFKSTSLCHHGIDHGDFSRIFLRLKFCDPGSRCQQIGTGGFRCNPVVFLGVEGSGRFCWLHNRWRGDNEITMNHHFGLCLGLGSWFFLPCPCQGLIFSGDQWDAFKTRPSDIHSLNYAQLVQWRWWFLLSNMRLHFWEYHIPHLVMSLFDLMWHAVYQKNSKELPPLPSPCGLHKDPARDCARAQSSGKQMVNRSTSKHAQKYPWNKLWPRFTRDRGIKIQSIYFDFGYGVPRITQGGSIRLCFGNRSAGSQCPSFWREVTLESRESLQ